MSHFNEDDDAEFFTDDVKFIADLLKENWGTFHKWNLERPPIIYEPEQWMTNAANAAVFVYQVSRYNSVSTTDYSTIQRTSFVAVRTSARHRKVFRKMVDEVYQIIYAHRRVGQNKLNGYTFMEIINDRDTNDYLGWYGNTLDIKLTTYNYPVASDGYGICRDDDEGSV